MNCYDGPQPLDSPLDSVHIPRALNKGKIGRECAIKEYAAPRYGPPHPNCPSRTAHAFPTSHCRQSGGVQSRWLIRAIHCQTPSTQWARSTDGHPRECNLYYARNRVQRYQQGGYGRVSEEPASTEPMTPTSPLFDNRCRGWIEL